MMNPRRSIQLGTLRFLDRRKWRIAVITAIVFSSLCEHHICQAQQTLKQVHVITRHGSRHPLSKDANTLEEETSESSLLTPIGQQQHYQLGVWLRERYETTSFGKDLFQEYSPNHVYFESSAYERTLVSANSLALGLFPTESRGVQLIPDTPPIIPVYSRARHNDITIRAYDKCPAFLDNLEKAYQSKTFVGMEQDAMPLLKRVAAIPSFRQWVETTKDGVTPYIPLKQLWNVYDAIHVAKLECPNVSCPDPNLAASSVNDQDWAEIQELAHATELLKYGGGVAHNYLGGSLWNSILQRMQANDLAITDGNHVAHHLMTNRLFVTSAHYPTLLGLFAALDIPFVTTNQELVLPEYASALILEVYQDDATFERSVQIWYKSGSQVDAAGVKVSGDCRTDDSANGCPLTTLEAKLLKNKAALEPADWCKACGNTQADVCLEQELKALQASCSSSNTSNNNTTMAALFFGGMLTMAMMFLIASTFCCRRTQSYYQEEITPKVTTDLKPPDLETNGNGHNNMNGNGYNMNGNGPAAVETFMA